MPIYIQQFNLIKPIFTSHAKVMIMTLLLMNPKKWFYQNEIQTILKLPYTAIRLQLMKLNKMGWLTHRADGNRQYYQVASQLFVYSEFKNILLKTTAIGDHLRWRMKAPSDILFAFVHGTYAEGIIEESSLLDVFIVGGMKSASLEKAFAWAKKIHLRETRWVQISKDDFIRKVGDGDKFIRKTLLSPKVYVVGDYEDTLKLLQEHHLSLTP